MLIIVQDHHLEQLPFIGKRSVPPTIRPDHWMPHCALTFPTPEQGHNAYRKLREFRKLHELSWEKTSPGLKLKSIKKRIGNIMNQRANTSADIAEVLRIQQLHGEDMTKAFDEHKKKAKEYMDKKWAEIDALTTAAKEKKKEADNVKWLEHQIRSLTMKMNMKHNQNDADQKRLKNAKIIQEIRLRKIQYALRKTEQLKTIQEGLVRTAEFANDPEAEDLLAKEKRRLALLREAIQNPGPHRRSNKLSQGLFLKTQANIKKWEDALAAKAQIESGDHVIARSVLPDYLKESPRTPYTLKGVSIRWADIKDALYAAGQWPDAIEHELLEVNKVRSSATWLRAEDYNIEALQAQDAGTQSLVTAA